MAGIANLHRLKPVLPKQQAAPSRGFSEELAGVGGRFAFIFMFAVNVDVDALDKPGVEPFLPGRELLRRVVFQAKARVGEAGGEHVGRCLLFGFGQAKGGLVLSEDGVRFVGVPRRVSYFESE